MHLFLSEYNFKNLMQYLDLRKIHELSAFSVQK